MNQDANPEHGYSQIEGGGHRVSIRRIHDDAFLLKQEPGTGQASDEIHPVLPGAEHAEHRRNGRPAMSRVAVATPRAIGQGRAQQHDGGDEELDGEGHQAFQMVLGRVCTAAIALRVSMMQLDQSATCW